MLSVLGTAKVLYYAFSHLILKVRHCYFPHFPDEDINWVSQGHTVIRCQRRD
jgi:hypothetical protein